MATEKRSIGKVIILRKIWSFFTGIAVLLVVYACFYMVCIISEEEILDEEYACMAQQLVEDSLRPVDSCKNQCNE